MKLDPSLKWRDLDGYSTSQTSNNYTKGNQIEDTIAPIITSPAIISIEQNISLGQVIYTVTASDNVGIKSYAIGGTDASAFTIDQTTGEITITDPNFDIENFYTFEVTVSDESNNTKSLVVSLNNEEDLVTWGETRYIMFRGTDANGQYNNIGELDILDTDGNDLIDNGTLDANDFTYRYGGGYYTSSSGVDLFDETPSDAYANNTFSNSTGQKWVLIDLGQTVEVGSLTIQARSNSTSHINRITHMTVFTSNRNDTGFAYSGTENTNNKNENLVLERSIDQMKLYPSLKWRDLDNYSTSQTSIKYSVAYQNEDTIAPVITSPNTVSVEENIGAGQEIYTVTATDNVGVTSYAIAGADASAFTINANTGVVTLVDNPDFETKNSFTFEITATDVFGNTSIPFPVNLIITDVDEESPVITSGRKTRDVVSYDTNPLIYTIEATDNVAVSKYYFSGDELLGGTSYTTAYLNENNDYVVLEINTISGNILFRGASNYSNLPATYNFAVTAIDEKRNISDSLIVSLTIRNIERTIGETRYIMFRGTDDNGEFNNIGELDIYDVDGNDLIGNGTLNTNNFTYRYGGGYFSSSSNSIGDASSTSSQPGLNLFDNSVSSPYANNLFSESSGEKWVLIDLGQTVEVGSLNIQARSNSTNHINRITHMTVFTSNRNDTGFSYTGSASGDANEDLTLGRTINQMKSDTTLKWFDLDVFSSQATTREFIEPSIGIEPTITSSNSADNILENSGTGQLVYTAETSNDNGTVNYSIYGIAVNEFTINPNTGEVFLIENPDFETKNAYTFRVIATDNHGNTSTPHQVTFSVIDIDEEDPVITSSNSTNSIAENSGAGQEIYTVTASDNIGIDSYAITGTDASAFNIDTNTGVVTLIDNPDFETQESYYF